MAKQGSLFKLTLTIIIVFVVVTYAIFNTRLLIKGPEIEIIDLVSGQKIEEDLVEIKGKVNDISFISLNDRQIFIDENKMFKEKILLTNKINNVKIYAENKFGKSDLKEIILVKGNI